MSTKIYRDLEREMNKETSKNNIVEVSKALFLEGGFSQTNMADIAQMAKISRKTLYRYFRSKEEIAMEIELDVFRTFVSIQNKYVPTLKGSGYDKLASYLEKLDSMVDELSQLIRFTGMFDYYLVGEYPNTGSHKEFVQLIEKVDEPFFAFLSEGVKDGSIVTDVEIAYLARTLSNSFLALAQRVVTRQTNLNEELNIDSRKIISVQRELFLRALKGKN
ncbi:MAG: TetR/AcrR family transcriptional regulator [Erysipelotrichaceae bacterium]|nr:TetR/AcrR family transcriptional regulator [Erysipelotrichaceae bacterium]